MNASQVTTRNRKNVKIIRSLATVAVLTFFVAGPVEARNRNRMPQVQIESKFVEVQNQDLRELGVDKNQACSSTPRIEVLRDGPGSSNSRRGRNRPAINNFNGQDFGRAPLSLRGVYLIAPVAPQGNTTYNIGDTDYSRRRAEERAQRRVIIDALKANGVIRDRSQTSTTTTKPKPKPIPKPVLKPTPKPKPKPKSTTLPNGDTVTDYPDGRREIKLKNGDTVTTYPNGKRVIRAFNGDTTETHPSGYRKTMTRYGTGRAVYPDGTTVDYTNSGKIILTTKDGKKYSRTKGTQFKEID
jgi:hypothetical protein